MSIQKAQPRRELPSLNELYENDTLELLESDAKLAVLLNAPPNPTWIKAKQGVKYLPIARVRWLLSRIFVEWKPEILHSFQAWNGVCVAARIHYRHPSGEMRFVDGAGAAKIQFKKDTLPLPENIVQDSLERAYPAAYSFALKNAAKNLGRLFGARLNEGEDDIDYDLVLSRFDSMPVEELEIAEIEALLNGISDSEFRKRLCDFLGVKSLAELPKHKVKQAKARILDAINNGAKS